MLRDFDEARGADGREQPIARKSDWAVHDMPRRRKRFILERSFTPEQIQWLRRGGIPQDMDQRWFWYMEEDRLYVHRSWSGICIYIVDFRFDTNCHQAYVNRDKREYGNRDLELDRQTLESLLDQWARHCEY